jgi:ABC-type sugar transport system substrate-binding protein
MKKLRFVVNLMTQENDFQLAQAAAAEEAARRLDVNVEIVYADSDPVTQSTQLLKIIQADPATHPAAILFQPIGGIALPQVARAAAAAGIGWVVLNRYAEYLSELRATSRAPLFSISTDHREVGRIQARQIAALLPGGGAVLYIQGPHGSSAAGERTSSMQAAKPENVHVTMLRGQWTERSAQASVSSWLRLTGSQRAQVDLVVAQNDVMAIGARKALEELKEANRDRWLNLQYTGCDGLPETGQAWVRSGLLAATIVVPPNTGQALALLVQALREGIRPPENVRTTPASFPSLESLLSMRSRELHA